MPVVRPTFVGTHDKPASHGFTPTEMMQFALLGAASVESCKDDARNAAQINKGKGKRLLIIKRHRCASRFSNVLRAAVDRGLYAVLFSIALGILTEISTSVRKTSDLT